MHSATVNSIQIFTNSDTCYVLSFAIIMLNTIAHHNPSVKDKPGVEQFITMNRGINDGKDVPKELLISHSTVIKTEPFKIPEDDGNDLMHLLQHRTRRAGSVTGCRYSRAGSDAGLS